MATKAKHFIPEHYRSLTPYLIICNCAAALDFYKAAFGAEEMTRMSTPDGLIGHAEIRVGDCMVMMADESPHMGARSPLDLGGTSVGLCLYVENCDAVFAAAVRGGATVERPLADQFYGDRSGTVVDPFGHKWTVATHIEDVSPEEMRERMSH